MQTFEDENEKYSYFYYAYDGVMKCNVLTSIKYDSKEDIFIAENLLSQGRLEHGYWDNLDKSRAFFRKGWNRNDFIGESEDDITQEEFLEIYNKYENLPAWDEYLN